MNIRSEQLKIPWEWQRVQKHVTIIEHDYVTYLWECNCISNNFDKTVNQSE
jgi:hypothetical protein